MTFHVLDSCCQKTFWPILSPQNPQCNNCSHLLPQIKGKRPLCCTEFQILLMEKVLIKDMGFGFDSEEVNKDVVNK